MFLESYNRRDFEANGIDDVFVQDNHSRSRRGVLRGIHYQDRTAPMVKLVRCTAGRILDVAVDLRVGSPTFSRWVSAELDGDTLRELLVPVGFGHAFLTLSDWADVEYKCSHVYTPEAEGCIRWSDPELAIPWPVAAPTVSPRDEQGMSLQAYRERPAFHYAEVR